jgi:hypothetical protein
MLLLQVRLMYGTKACYMRVLRADTANQLLLTRLERLNWWLWKGALLFHVIVALQLCALAMSAAAGKCCKRMLSA